MNKIRFEIQKGEFGDLVVPFVDERSLIAVLKEIELPMARAERNPMIAGAYAGINKIAVEPPSKHLLGDAKKIYMYDAKTTVLDCECGEPGCWSFVVLISHDYNIVRWENFQQVHRSSWSYEALGPFTFDRGEYTKAIESIV